MSNSTDRIIENAAIYVRRLSPEGRDQARRARERRTARVKRAVTHSGLGGVSWLAGMGICDALGYMVINPVTIGLNVVGIAGVVAWNIWRTRDKAVPEPVIKEGPASLSKVVEASYMWYVGNPGMPGNINIFATFANLQEAVKGLTTDSPESTLIQTLLVEDLAGLVKNYLVIPENLRKRAEGKELTPYEQLCEGIQVIKLELDKVIMRLNKRETEALAQQNAYLNLKYGEDKTNPA